MSNSVTGAGRVSSATAEAHAPATSTIAARTGASVSLVEIDQATQLPVPPRFPWLSRLAATLEPAAKQKPAFPTQPSLGNNLDRSA